MQPKRLVGPPLLFLVVSGIAIVAATAGVLIEKGPISVVFAAIAALAVWRLLGVSVDLAGTELIVHNVLRTFRFPASQVDIRARVVDPRRETYSAADTEGYPEIPAAADDNTPQAAKWYVLEHRDNLHLIDALMARTPPNHERLAWQLRQEILAARDIKP